MNVADAMNALRSGYEHGRWTIEHLDQPSPGRLLLERETKLNPHINDSFELPPHRNLLRESLNL